MIEEEPTWRVKIIEHECLNDQSTCDRQRKWDFEYHTKVYRCVIRTRYRYFLWCGEETSSKEDMFHHVEVWHIKDVDTERCFDSLNMRSVSFTKV